MKLSSGSLPDRHFGQPVEKLGAAEFLGQFADRPFLLQLTRLEAAAYTSNRETVKGTIHPRPASLEMLRHTQKEAQHMHKTTHNGK